MENCLSCSKELFSVVRFCPYCAKLVAADAVPDEPEASDEATPARREPVVSSPPSASDAGAVDLAAIPAVPVLPTERPARKKGRPTGGATSQEKVDASPIIQNPAGAADSTSSAAQEIEPQKTTAKPGKGKFIVIGIGVLVAATYFLGHRSDDGKVACQTAIDTGMAYLKAGKLAGAMQQAQATSLACVDKHAPLATQFNVELNKATQKICLRPLTNIRSRIQAHRISSAQSALDNVDPICAQTEDVRTMRAELAQVQAGAIDVVSRAEQAIQQEDVEGARRAIAELEQIDRETKDASRLKGLVAMIKPKQDLAPTAVEAQTPAVVSSAAPVRSSSSQAQLPQAAPSVNQAAVAAERFLRQAETAMQQQKFDVAKTYIESARQTDPSNPRINPLMRQVTEKERRVLQEETTIK